MKKKTISQTIIYYMVIRIIIPFCLILAVLVGYLIREEYNSQKQYINSVVDQITDNAESVLEIVNYSTSTFLANKKVLNSIKKFSEHPQNTYERYCYFKEIRDYLNDITNSTLIPFNGEMLILTPNSYVGSNAYGTCTGDYHSQKWYKDIIAGERDCTYYSDLGYLFTELLGSYYGDLQRQSVYIGRSIITYSGEKLGIIIVRIPSDGLWKIFMDSMYENSNAYSNLLLMDGDYHKIAEYRNSEWELSDEKLKIMLKKNGDGWNDYYCTERGLSTGELHLVFVGNQFTLFRNNFLTLIIMVGIILMLISVITISAKSISQKVSLPISDLADSLDNSDFSMPLVVDDNGYIEISRLIMSYNRAARRIEELVAAIRIESKLKEEAYYEKMTSQMSPHFIFNTVNCIQYLARNNGDGETEQALLAFGDLLQSVYANKEDFSTIGRESQLLESYIQIMKLRFGENFIYMNLIPSTLFDCEIPNFSLQPLVENAILHGVWNMKTGQIILSAMLVEDIIHITIFDNGMQPDTERIERILEKTSESKEKVAGIGLYNINMRLKMLYGEQFGLSYNKKIDTGFEICMDIPKKIRKM